MLITRVCIAITAAITCLFAACSPEAGPPEQTQRTPPLGTTLTSALSASATPVDTSTLTPTVTNTPQPEPTATLSPTPSPIQAQDIGSLEVFAQLEFQSGEPVLALTWSQDGERIVIAVNTKVYVYSVESLERMLVLEVGVFTRALAFDPIRTDILATGSNDGMIRIWDLATQQILMSFSSHPKGITQVAFHPSGKMLASSGNDALVHLWDIVSGEEITWLIGGAFAVPDLLFHPDEGSIITADGGVIRYREVESQRLIRNMRVDAPIYALAVDGSGEILAAGTVGEIQIWNLQNGEMIERLEGSAFGSVWSLSFNRLGNVLASGWRDGQVCLYAWQVSESACYQTHQNSVDSLVFNPAGSILATSSYDGRVNFWRR